MEQGSMGQAAKALDTLFHEHNLSFVLSNPREPDNPIVFASSKFFQTTGYAAQEILGRNCRILQGPATSRQTVMEIRDAIREERSTSVCLINYRKDGTPFWNAFHLAPVRSESGTVEWFIGIQADVTRLVGSKEADAAAGVQAVTEGELQQATRIAQSILCHHAEMQAQKLHTCGAADSVPSSLMCALGLIKECFVLSDPSQVDNPMVYCSPAFLRLTGYSCRELIGRNCRMLQGPGTDQAAVQTIRDALKACPPRPVTATVLNYRKDGTTFYNCLHIGPIRDATGRVQFFCGVQLDVTAAEKAEAAGSGAAAAVELPCEGTGGGGSAAPPVSEAPVPTVLQLLMQKGVVGSVRVAARSLSSKGLRRAPSDQRTPSQHSE